MKTYILLPFIIAYSLILYGCGDEDAGPAPVDATFNPAQADINLAFQSRANRLFNMNCSLGLATADDVQFTCGANSYFAHLVSGKDPIHADYAQDKKCFDKKWKYSYRIYSDAAQKNEVNVLSLFLAKEVCAS